MPNCACQLMRTSLTAKACYRGRRRDVAGCRCGIYAGLYTPPEAPARHALTLSLTTSFLDKGVGALVLAQGLLERRGKSIYFARAEAWVDEQRLIATAQGTFKYLR